MIHLSGKDSFVIYQDSNSKKNKISIGKWKLLDLQLLPHHLFVMYHILNIEEQNIQIQTICS